MIVNQRVRYAIWVSNLNQTQVAEELGVSQPMINKYLKGLSTPNDDILAKLANISKLDFRWLKTGVRELEPTDFYEFVETIGLTKEELISKVIAMRDKINEYEEKLELAKEAIAAWKAKKK